MVIIMEVHLHLTTHHPTIVDIAQVPHAAILHIMILIMIHTMEVTMLKSHI
jgi:hypothetical protein